MKSAKASATPQKPVEVTVSVIRFRDILAAKSSARGETEHVMKLARRDPRAYVRSDNLYVRKPGAPIRFTLVAPRGDSQRYFPLGIAFIRQGVPSETEEERLGFLNFPQRETRAEGESIVILDVYRDWTPGSRYKFTLYLQRGSDGAVGLIDPGIIHTGDQ